MKRFLLSTAIFSVTSLMAACGSGSPVEEPPALSGPAMVSAANPHAVEAGLEALRNGGDAIDAAIAVQSVLGLVEPQSSGLGGGAFILYYDAQTGDVTVYDGRETAPAGAGPDLFLDETGEPLSFFDAVLSGRSIGVPGAVPALARAHQDHGTLDWAAGFTHAEQLAADGFEVSPRLHGLLAGFGRRSPLDDWTATRDYFYTDDGEPLPVGHLLQNPAYAATVRALAENPRALHEGPIAAAIIEAVQDQPRPGGLTLEDLASYEAVVRSPICRPYRQWTICGAPPPASGGVTVNEIMGLLEQYDMSATGPDTLEGWRRFIEASRLAYADRDAYVADADHVFVPVEGLLADDYIEARATLMDRDTAIETSTPGVPAGIDAPGADATPDAPGTSHFVVVDSDGDVVSMTTTIEGAFGSHRMAGGFLLNNQLTDFSRTPVDADGRAIPNAPDGGKRPRSSMSPTLVFDENGEFVLATGSPGGSSIIAYTAKTLVGMLDWGLTPQEAIELPNIVARGDVVRIENGMDIRILAGLQELGFELDANRGEISGIHIVRRLEDGSLIGGADPRREGIVGEP